MFFSIRIIYYMCSVHYPRHAFQKSLRSSGAAVVHFEVCHIATGFDLYGFAVVAADVEHSPDIREELKGIGRFLLKMGQPHRRGSRQGECFRESGIVEEHSPDERTKMQSRDESAFAHRAMAAGFKFSLHTVS
jgi:hypothetical protein